MTLITHKRESGGIDMPILAIKRVGRFGTPTRGNARDQL